MDIKMATRRLGHDDGEPVLSNLVNHPPTHHDHYTDIIVVGSRSN